MSSATTFALCFPRGKFPTGIHAMERLLSASDAQR